MAETYSVGDHFTNKDASVRVLYDQLVSLLLKVRISSSKDFDEDLKTWLKEAYLLSE